MKSLSTVCFLQGVYYFLSGIWPVVSIESFMAVTGPKVEIWLVKTVGLLVLVQGAWFIGTAYKKELGFREAILASGLASAFCVIDFYYSLTDQIPAVYMLDGFVQIGLIIGWIVAYLKIREHKRSSAAHV